MEHKVTLGIDAPKRTDALKIAEALIDIRKALSDEDLFQLRKILIEQPGMIQTVKRLLS